MKVYIFCAQTAITHIFGTLMICPHCWGFNSSAVSMQKLYYTHANNQCRISHSEARAVSQLITAK